MRPLNGKWTARPGNFDPLHGQDTFEGIGDYGMPMIQPERDWPDWILAYDDWRTKSKKGTLPEESGASGIHFFTEDYRFEAIWNNPERTLAQLTADFLLTPDFSLYIDHPRAIQIWNTYRNRWVGAYWQRAGKRVIPTVGWSDASSYNFCFDGLPRHAVLAVATTTLKRDREALKFFIEGYTEMVRRLDPVMIVCYTVGLPAEVANIAPVKCFKTWAHERFNAKRTSELAANREA